MTEWCTARSIAAAVAMELAKMRSHSEETKGDVFTPATFCASVCSTSRLARTDAVQYVAGVMDSPSCTSR